jgi:hypothetical protein
MPEPLHPVPGVGKFIHQSTVIIGGTMNLVDRAKNIIMTPQTEWTAVAAEEPSVPQILTGYVIPLALIPAIASFIGGTIMPGAFHFGATYLVGMAVVSFVSALVGVFLSSYVIDFLAPNFGSEKNLGRTFQLVAYSYTPAWVAGVFQIIPVIGVLASVAGLYGIYLMYLGLPVLKKTPADKTVVYLVVSFLVLMVIYVVLSAIFAAIILGVLGVSAVTSWVFGQ